MAIVGGGTAFADYFWKPHDTAVSVTDANAASAPLTQGGLP